MSEQATRRVSVWRTVGRAHGLIVRNPKRLLRAAMPAAALMTAIFLIHSQLPRIFMRIETISCLALLSVPMALLSWQWMRGIGGAMATTDRNAQRNHAPFIRYAITAIPWFLALLLSPVASVLLIVAGIKVAAATSSSTSLPSDLPLMEFSYLWLAILVGWYLIAGRTLPLLAVLAVNGNGSFRQSWRQSAGQGRRISAALFIASVSGLAIRFVLFLLASMVAAVLFWVWTGLAADMRNSALGTAVQYLGAMIMLAMTSTLIGGVLIAVQQQIAPASGEADRALVLVFD